LPIIDPWYQKDFYIKWCQCTVGFEAENGINNLNFWEELPCGLYGISFDAPKLDGFLVGEGIKHEWRDAILKELLDWERTSVEPKPEDLYISLCKPPREQHDVHSPSSNILPSKSGGIHVDIPNFSCNIWTTSILTHGDDSRI